jgi:GTP-binding protein
VFADRSLARVSSRPGKTTLANFYRLCTGETWIDLPGYGYARVSKGEKERLAALVHECCVSRPGLAGIIWLLDIRHPGLAADIEAWEFIAGLRLPVLCVLTKCDKVSRGQSAALTVTHAAVYSRPLVQVRYSTMVAQSREVFWTAYRGWREQGK